MNKVYVRENKSIFTISRMRIILLIPIILYGLYKNGIFLYQKGYIDLFHLFKPLILLVVSIFIGCLVNILYEYVFKHSKDNLKNVLFSSFHIEYAIILTCLLAINTNIIIYSIVTFVIFMLSKFLNNRINTVAITFLCIYFISLIDGSLVFKNAYELDKTLSLTFFDLLIGRGEGGLFSTNILLLILSIILLQVTNNSKTIISITTLITYVLLVIAGYFIFKYDINSLLFYPNILFALMYVSTDSVTSCYTEKGEVIYAILISVLTYIIGFYNKTISVFVAIAIVSLFNSVIDRIVLKNVK